MTTYNIGSLIALLQQQVAQNFTPSPLVDIAQTRILPSLTAISIYEVMTGSQAEITLQDPVDFSSSNQILQSLTSVIGGVQQTQAPWAPYVLNNLSEILVNLHLSNLSTLSTLSSSPFTPIYTQLQSYFPSSTQPTNTPVVPANASVTQLSWGDLTPVPCPLTQPGHYPSTHSDLHNTIQSLTNYCNSTFWTPELVDICGKLLCVYADFKAIGQSTGQLPQ